MKDIRWNFLQLHVNLLFKTKNKTQTKTRNKKDRRLILVRKVTKYRCPYCAGKDNDISQDETERASIKTTNSQLMYKAIYNSVSRTWSAVVNYCIQEPDRLTWIWTSRGTGLTLGLKLKSPVSPTPNQSAKSLYNSKDMRFISGKKIWQENAKAICLNLQECFDQKMTIKGKIRN